MLGVMPGLASGYSLEYFDCRSLTRIDKFATPTACDPFAADEEVEAVKSFIQNGGIDAAYSVT